MEHAHFLGTHGQWFWIVPLLFMIVMFVLGSFMCRRMGAWRRRPAYSGHGRFNCCRPGRDSRSDRWSETPGQILDRRFATCEPSLAVEAGFTQSTLPPTLTARPDPTSS
jgi:hypothetical protein